MSPPNPENDPVHKGLHQLGQQIEGEDPVMPASSVDAVAHNPVENPVGHPVDNPVDNPVEKGLHDLGRQIEHNLSAGVIMRADAEHFRYTWRGCFYLWFEVVKDMIGV